MSLVMKGFPPKDPDQVTLSNWRTAPFNKWGFQHVREIIPSANIANNPKDVWSLTKGKDNLSSKVFKLLKFIDSNEFKNFFSLNSIFILSLIKLIILRKVFSEDLTISSYLIINPKFGFFKLKLFHEL